MIIKELYQNNRVTIESRTHKTGHVEYWVQAGQAGIFLYGDDLADLNELLSALLEELSQNEH